MAPTWCGARDKGRQIVSATNLRAVLAADPELGAGNVLLRLAEHGADMDMPRVTFDTGFDAIAAWTPLSLRALTERVTARAEWFARRGIGQRDPVAVYVTSAADMILNFLALTWLRATPPLMNGSTPADSAVEYIRRLRFDAIAAWTPLSLRALTERVTARAEWFARRGIGQRDPVALPY